LNVKPDSRLVDLAVKRFGLTDDFFESGWLLYDGRLLDLSGRHRSSGYFRDGDRWKVYPGEEDYMAGTRSVSHEVSAKNLGMTIWTMATRLRAIRIQGCNGVEVFGMPSDAQLTRIARALRDECIPRWASMGLQTFYIDFYEREPNASGVFRAIGHGMLDSREPGSTKGLTRARLEGWIKKRILITHKNHELWFHDPCICLEGDEHCCPKYRGRRG
jgi:hypothetical protein